jgi:hypothetical protein
MDKKRNQRIRVDPIYYYDDFYSDPMNRQDEQDYYLYCHGTRFLWRQLLSFYSKKDEVWIRYKKVNIYLTKKKIPTKNSRDEQLLIK